MKKVLISTLAYDGGKSGIANYIENVVKALSVNSSIELIVNEDEVKYFNNISENISFRIVPRFYAKPLFNVAWHLFVLPFMIKKDRYEWMFLPAGNRRLMCFYPIKTFVTMHDLSQFHVQNKYDRFRMIYIKKVIPFFLKSADKIFTVSENTANDMVTHYKMKRENLIVNYNGVNTEKFMPLHQWEKKVKPYILYVARIEHPGKNHLNLIKAYEKLDKIYKEKYDLYLVGSDWNGAEVVHKYANASSDSKRIKFLGYVENSALPKYYHNASLFVFPSFYEGFGIPILEAMASGVAVASSSTSSLPEVGGNAALYFDPESPVSISEVISTILGDSRCRENMSTLGLEQVKKFTWSKHIEILQNNV
ncbi:MAG: glycosyltransferase involved in cell wall biosynthesis [Sulfurimonas sp.]|jgi:glycosyltransferase involved in cell wall biosynthesis|uniref:glycosyltransferase family 4 protein n=1 Tax=Sulfurimonas sp. TaxID=2022749 RepID=UPI0039E49AAB